LYVSNITITRRQNAIALHRRFLERAIAAGQPTKGLDKLFAESLQISASMWSQIKSSRPISEALARQIESHCSVEAGWLDEPREHETPDACEERFIQSAREAWRSSTAKQKRELAKLLKEFCAGNTL
jgi:hypothetical protein